MFLKPLKIALVAALPLMSAGGAMAASVTVLKQYPTAQNEERADAALKEQLSRQGFTDVALNRTGDRIDVQGERQGEQITLRYDNASGRLLEVNGKPALLADTQKDAMSGRGSAGDMN
ncbi:hypothetical protein [Paracoccus laeviglucosivorans]|uniref:Peptidase propeptide and YPEB domain-containing protein n=1 Tax=Paracoccus laeviglucosivorans TaxID=1197861 RepID=A0A521CBV2_9RHOB|nr:hypothetical protein [Paracoccus laeviglucosivorans]SMO56281.1 hypothetical protein SAMN06265221_104115 [Paracoccus laeviglucosivorans]